MNPRTRKFIGTIIIILFVCVYALTAMAIAQARNVLPLMSGLGFLISPLVVGVFAGASVSVWRALKDEPALDIAV